MKEIFQTIYDKDVKSFSFKQDIQVYPKQYKDGEIYATEVDVAEPYYVINFEDGTKIIVDLTEVLVMLFNLKNK